MLTCINGSVVLATTEYLSVGGRVGFTGSSSDFIYGQKLDSQNIPLTHFTKD